MTKHILLSVCLLSIIFIVHSQEVIVCSFFEDDKCTEISRGFAGYKYGWEPSSKEIPIGCFKDDMSYLKITVSDDKTKFFRKKFGIQNSLCDEKDYPTDQFTHFLNTCRLKYQCKIIDNSTSEVAPVAGKEFNLKIQKYLDKTLKKLNNTITIPLYTCEEAELVLQNSTKLYRFKEELDIQHPKIVKKFVKGKMNVAMTHVLMDFYDGNCESEPFQTIRYFFNATSEYNKFLLEVRKSPVEKDTLHVGTASKSKNKH